MKARKIPVTVEVWEFSRFNLRKEDSWVKLFPEKIKLVNQYGGELIYLEIETLEGTMRANQFDYIIKGVNGEFYPCKPDIFEKTYEIA